MLEASLPLQAEHMTAAEGAERWAARMMTTAVSLLAASPLPDVSNPEVAEAA
jgi:hypothetical protein